VFVIEKTNGVIANANDASHAGTTRKKDS